MSVKYIYKYIYKGSDRITLSEGNTILLKDNITVRVNYIFPVEALNEVHKEEINVTSFKYRR